MTDSHDPAAPRRRLQDVARRAGGVIAAALLMLGAPSAALAAGPAAPAGCTGPASGTWLRIVAEGVKSASGSIAITLYPDMPSRFLAHHGSLYVTFVRASAGNTEGCIYLPKPGVYVIALYHDANDNRKFDRTSVGLPDEAYGFSNNPPTLFGLPSFRSVRLNVSRSGLTSHIQMKYP
ncbi:MAG: DUF2141 domain-containing protein [Sphingomonadales bacterium]|nr:DUF2141 domain-containing protein [Sphingomonadales bacterium]